MTNKQSTVLSQIMPYELDTKKNGKIQTGLKEYRTLLQALFEAIFHIQNCELEKFDSLVGENACQIRAVRVALLATKHSMDITNLKKLITNALSKIDVLLEPKTISRLMHSNDTLKEVIVKENLDISLSPDELFVMKSYLLTEMKTVTSSHLTMASICRIEAADPKKLNRLGDISTSFARNLLSRLRRLLANASVQFVRQCAFTNQSKSLVQMASEEFTLEENTLPCIPMFWTYKTLLATAQKEKIPLLLHVKFLGEVLGGFNIIDEEFALFTPSTDGNYVLTKPDESDLNKPACVVQGIATQNEKGEILSKSKWLAAIEETGVLNVILAGAADHRQFPNPALDAKIEELNDSEYTAYKTLAKDRGFSIENPTTFFIQHVYACRIGKIIEEVFPKTHFSGNNRSAIQGMTPFNGLNCCLRSNFKEARL